MSLVLTRAGVGSEAPRQRAHSPRVAGLPQELELSELTGRTDESAQVLCADRARQSSGALGEQSRSAADTGNASEANFSGPACAGKPKFSEKECNPEIRVCQPPVPLVSDHSMACG